MIYPHIVVPLLEPTESQKGPVNVERAGTQQTHPLTAWYATCRRLPTKSSSNIRYLLIYVSRALKVASVFEEGEINDEEIPEAPVALGAPPMAEPKLSDLAKMAFKSFVSGLWRTERRIPSSVARDPDFPIRAFSWHPYLAKFAVAPQDNSVRIYDMNAGTWSSLALQHELQKKIFALAWKPMSGHTLAVGTKHGVLVWKIVNKSVAGANQPHAAQPSAAAIAAQRLGAGLESQYANLTTAWRELGLEGAHSANGAGPGSWASTSAPNKLQDMGAWCQVYRFAGIAPVNALTWSPGGRFLAAASANDSQVVIIDTVNDTQTPLSQLVAGNISKMYWSPNDEYLFVLSADSNTFRVFNTRNWSSERWAQLSRPLHSACWAGDGTHLAFTIKGESKLYVVRYSTVAGESTSSSSSVASAAQVKGALVACLDLAPYMAESRKGGADPDEEFGGALSYVAWDETSSRLAVALEGSELIAVYQCNALSYVVSFQPLGYLRGPPDTHISGLYFRPNFPRGALLTATFSNGKISFFPMYFKPSIL